MKQLFSKSFLILILFPALLFAQDSTSDNQGMIAYGKYDFVAGTKILFEDAVNGEQLGEFPAKWDLGEGKIEVASLDQHQVIAFMGDAYASIFPLWKNQNDYLPEMFTIEYDHYVKEGANTQMQINLRFGKTGATYDENDDFGSWINTGSGGEIAGVTGNYDGDYYNKWHHIALSYNKGNVKIYCDEKRLVNVPRVKGNPWGVAFGVTPSSSSPSYIKNIRIAEGGGNLYQRVVSDGKFVTRGILFDVNKSNIKPLSMGTINEIVSMMKEHPELKFEIDGHTDSDGDAAANQKLSEDRANAVKTQLVSMGITADHLTVKGFGASKPAVPNDSSEGKANNRRVEFIKI